MVGPGEDRVDLGQAGADGGERVIGQTRASTSLAARMIFQSSRASPGGYTARRPRCARPSVFTQVASFSV